MKSGYIGVHARVAEKELLLLLDTGAPATHLDPHRTKELGLTWKPLDVGDDLSSQTRQEWCEIDSVQIGPITTGRLQIKSKDFSDFNPYIKSCDDPLPDGLLGDDVLAAHAAIIDYSTYRLYLRTKARQRPRKSAVPEPPDESENNRFRIASIPFVKDGKKVKVVVKLDQFGGRTWKLEGTVDAHWKPIAECAEQAEPGESPFRRYEFGCHDVLTHSGENVMHLRFDRVTGRTWLLSALPNEQWKLIPEEQGSNALVSGEVARYQWACHDFLEPGKKREVYLKLDRFTGQTWKLDGAKAAQWITIFEQDDGQRPAAGDSCRYRFCCVELTSGEVYVRFDEQSGMAWRWSGTEPGWTFIKESLKQEK